MSADPPPIELAREPDFALGPLQVRPSTRMAAWAGREEVLEPRVMQVLVALARASGAVVSRDALIAACWEGRIVGEDAINRTIGRIRRLAEDSGAFTVETIARVGYRLKPAQPVAMPQPAAPMAGAPGTPVPAGRPWLWVGLGLALAALAGGAWWLTRPVNWQIEHFRMAVATPLFEVDPALAPNGTMIAYSAGPAPMARHIYIRSLTGGDPIQLTDGPNDNDMHPVWSPDSGSLAFVRHREGVPCTLLVKPVPAGDERIVGHCKQDDFTGLAWSHRENALYFADRPAPRRARRIMRLDLSSGAVSEVTHPPDDIVGDRSPRVSPDGRKLVYFHFERGNVAQIVLDLASSKATAVDAVGGLQAWIDDKTLIATAGGLTEPALWVVPLSGKPQKIAVNSSELGAVAAGPDGVFAVETFRDQTVLAAPPPAGEAPRVLEATSGASNGPVFAADGRLAFTHADPGGLFEIWIMAPGDKPRKVSAMAAHNVTCLRWSPDGRYLSFFGATKDEHGIFILNADGSGLRHLQHRTTTAMPAWTADSRGLIVPMKDTRGWRLYRIALDNPDHAVPASDYGWFAVATDGPAIYALGARGQAIWRVDGNPRFIANIRRRCTDSFAECHSWSVVNGTLVYADHSERAKPRIILHKIADGSETSIVAPGLENNDEIALDPTSGKLLYVYDGLSDSDIALFQLKRK